MTGTLFLEQSENINNHNIQSHLWSTPPPPQRRYQSLSSSRSRIKVKETTVLRVCKRDEGAPPSEPISQKCKERELGSVGDEGGVEPQSEELEVSRALALDYSCEKKRGRKKNWLPGCISLNFNIRLFIVCPDFRVQTALSISLSFFFGFIILQECERGKPWPCEEMVIKKKKVELPVCTSAWDSQSNWGLWAVSRGTCEIYKYICAHTHTHTYVLPNNCSIYVIYYCNKFLTCTDRCINIYLQLIYTQKHTFSVVCQSATV